MRFAVVMNSKARKVKHHSIEMMRRCVPDDDLFVTQTVEQSDACLDEIIVKRYPLVFCGGGDGTAMRIIEQLFRHVKRRRSEGEDVAMPRIGILKLGTGNGWAGQLEVPPKTEPIERFRRGRAERFSTFHMVMVEDRLAHMGGVGLDAGVLNDYIDMKNKYTKGFMWKMANSVFGYFFTIFFRSIPKFFKKGPSFSARIFNNSDETIYRINGQDQPEPIDVKKGELLHEGVLKWVGFATTENFGFNLKVFPFASTMPGYIHLRLIWTPISVLVAHIPSIWTGKFRKNSADFLIKSVVIESDNEMPFQLGGDPEGYRKQIVVELAPDTVEVLDFAR